MSDHRQKTVLIGITGCVAAYKAAELVRSLQKKDMRVKVVMTEHACEFIGPTTFRALTHEPVAVGLFDAAEDPIHHISLAQEADAFVIAPCTANVIAKLAHGIADDLLSTTALAITCPLIVAPAMNVNMYEHAATQTNIAILKSRGVLFVDAAEGYLACGDTGRGRLADIDCIVASVGEALSLCQDLADRKVMITAGPTIEPLDPVRYISNHSSGKMGFALAREAARRGAEVTVVAGPITCPVPEGVQVISVRTAQDMLEAAQEVFADNDIAIFAAAVCDVRPEGVAAQKLKKSEGNKALESISLTENPDILATLAAGKAEGQVVVGFAAETHDVVEHAQAKLVRKHADMIVANEVGEGKGFNCDTSKAWLIGGKSVRDIPETSKDDLARIILDEALSLLNG